MSCGVNGEKVSTGPFAMAPYRRAFADSPETKCCRRWASVERSLAADAATRASRATAGDRAEVTGLWTFDRARGDVWILSAIQQS